MSRAKSAGLARLRSDSEALELDAVRLSEDVEKWQEEFAQLALPQTPEEEPGGGADDNSLGPRNWDMLERVLERRAEAGRRLRQAAVLLEKPLAGVGLTFRFLSLPYLRRLAFALFFCVTSGYFNTVASAVAGYRTPRIQAGGVNGSERRGLARPAAAP